MKIQLTEIDRRLLERISEIINEDAGIDEDNWVEIDTLLAILDTLEDCYKDLKYEFDEYKVNVLDNYKPCEVNDNWRFYSQTISKQEKEITNLWGFIKEKGLEEDYGRYKERN